MTDDPGTSGDEPRFTQEDLDRILAERLKRARVDAEQLEELRARAERIPRLEQRIKTLEGERDQARQEATGALQRADGATLRAEVVSAATRAGAINPEHIYRLLPEGSVKLEDGKAVGVEEAIKTFAERETHLFAQPKTRPSGGDGGAREDGGRAGKDRATDMNRILRQGIGLQK